MGGLWRLLRHRRDLRLLLGAGLVSMTGDWLLGVGLSFSVYALTGSTLASAVTLLAALVPQTLGGLVAGVFVDRWDRKRTMIVANLLLAVGLVPLVLVRDADQIWVVYLVLVFESVVEVFFAPAEQAMLPRVVDEQQTGELVTANALNSQNQNLARLLGPALGGVAAAVGGIPAVAVLDAATFLVATVLLLRIRTPGRVHADRLDHPERVVTGRLAQLRQEWVEGLHASWAATPLRVLLVFCLITSVGEGIMGTLFAPYVRSVLHSGAQTLGVVTSAQAVGGIVGGLVVATFGARWSPVRMLGAGAVVFGLVDLAIFLYPLVLVQAWPAVLGMVVVGLPGAVVVAGMMTLFQQHSTDAQRGRVFALVMLARSLATVVGTTAAGFLGDAVGIVPVLAVQGVGYVVAGLLVLVVLTRTREAAPSRVAA
ncbi:MAG: MFS transporter [Nocardioidaceae bacterium]|nr:MFS transporter [Nocardioidaceae bacterium]